MNMKLSEVLSIFEFDYVINEDNTISLKDRYSANLGGIEKEKFPITENIASDLVDRLDVYIEDYLLADIREQYKELGCGKIEYNANFEEYLYHLKQHKDVFESDIYVLEHLNNTNLIDISELKENNNEK